ncbi:Protein-lysine N-methyltransferase efm4 [Exophiala oligosperma]
MAHPTHLDPSELGTKEYWDKYYQNDLDQQHQDRSEVDEDAADDDDDDTEETGLPDPSDLESWFDDVGAPAKTLEFLTSETFPLSPNYAGGDDDEDGDGDHQPSVLDLGTGNGSALFALRLEGEYTGRMVGVDYSSRSIELARKLHRQYFPPSSMAGSNTEKKEENDMTFEILDLVNDTPSTKPWWPVSEGGFDLVLDKGTFDAISLSSTTMTDPTTGKDRRMCEFYPAKILDMVRPSGFLLITSCNWTEEEVVSWFTGAQTSNDGTSSTARFVVHDRIKYPVFEFGGQKGQGVASVCFKKIQEPTSSR